MQGKAVPFDSVTINNLYDMPNIPYDDYTNYLENHLNLDEVLKFLTILRIEWKIAKDGSSTFSVSSIQFEEHKAWYYFIVARLMPTTHVSDVTQDQAILLYTIFTRKSTNMGKLLAY